VTAGKDQLKSVYDPTCGSGSCCCVWPKKSRTSVLLRSGDEPYHLQLHEHDYARCALQAFDIKNEDTLERPLHLDMRFEAIVANPPFRLIGLPVLCL
jgi:type I restriction enzyme M protein